MIEDRPPPYGDGLFQDRKPPLPGEMGMGPLAAQAAAHGRAHRPEEPARQHIVGGDESCLALARARGTQLAWVASFNLSLRTVALTTIRKQHKVWN